MLPNANILLYAKLLQIQSNSIKKMRTVLILIIFLFTNNLYAQFYGCDDPCPEKIKGFDILLKDTQQISNVNFYPLLMDFRFYNKCYCVYAFNHYYQDYEDRTKDTCISENQKLALKTYQDLNEIIKKRLSKYVEISQPKLSYLDSVIVMKEFSKIKLEFANSDSLKEDVNKNVSPELCAILKKFSADEHVFVDYLSNTCKSVVYNTEGKLKLYVINLKEQKIKYYNMILFCVKYDEAIPPEQTIRRVFKPYLEHLKKVYKNHVKTN